MIIRLTTAALATLAFATMAVAKGHDQTGTALGDGIPGTNATTETAAPAQTLGSIRGASCTTPASERKGSAC